MNSILWISIRNNEQSFEVESYLHSLADGKTHIVLNKSTSKHKLTYSSSRWVLTAKIRNGTEGLTPLFVSKSESQWLLSRHLLRMNTQYKEAFLHRGKLEFWELCLFVSKQKHWKDQMFPENQGDQSKSLFPLVIWSVKNLFCFAQKKESILF